MMVSTTNKKIGRVIPKEKKRKENLLETDLNLLHDGGKKKKIINKGNQSISSFIKI